VPQRPDDPSIGGDERLWRRVHPTQIELNPHTRQPDVSSGVFSTREEVSVTIASETTQADFLRDYPDHSVIEFTAGAARALGCTVVRDAQPHDPAHALVCGNRSRGQLNKTQQELLNQASRLVVVGRMAGARQES
jgi:hypothetical protein